MRNKLFAVLAALAVAVVLGASSARADQISLGDSCTGTLSVTPGAPPTVGGSVSNCAATWEQGTPPFNDNGLFSITGGTGFASGSFSDGTSTLSGTINWTNFSGNTLDGYITVSSATGFNGEFSQGGVYWIDRTFQPGTCSADGNTLYGCKVSSGEILTPEPGTWTRLGTGLLTMAGFIRRKLSA